MNVPTYIVDDPNLVKQICIKDFDSFTNHAKFAAADGDALFSRAMVVLNDTEWKNMRTILSPAFTGMIYF